jgi:signal peptidase I, bacterial type
LLFVAGVYVNHTNSGYPMIKDGDLCITYKLANLNKGDEIAYVKDGKIKFGRVVAMPGDTVDISEDKIVVNGMGVYEDTVYPTTAEGSAISYPYKVSSETVFVLNDYRDDITDSRTYGSIPLSETKGKIVLVLRRRGI